MPNATFGECQNNVWRLPKQRLQKYQIMIFETLLPCDNYQIQTLQYVVQIKYLMLRILITVLLSWQSLNRVFQISMKLSHIGKNQGWVYLDKMSFAPGTVQYKIRTQPKGIPYGAGGTVTLEAIPEYFWQQQKQRKCQDIPKEPYIKHRVSLGQSAVDFSRQFFNLQNTTLYYFVLKDCQRTLQAQYSNKNLSLKIRLHLINNNKQTGQQEDHWYIVAVIVLAGVWLVYFYNGKMKSAHLQTQWHKIVMFSGIATQIFSLTCKTSGFLIYVYTGSDYGFFHVIFLLMHSISQSLVIGLIVLIGFGWTINYSTLKDSELYIPLLGGLAFMNALLTLLTKLQSNQQDRHHTFDNISGHVIIGYRILILLVFMIAIINTYQKSITKVKNFILFFALFGGLYISGLPFIILIGNCFIQAKDRHEFVFVTMEGLKCLTNIAISIMLNHQKSYYNEITHQKRSFLPEEESKHF